MSDMALGKRPLPVGAIGRTGPGWWGIVCVIATEASLFAYLLFSYFYYAVQIADGWIPKSPSFGYSLPGIICLIVSGAAVWWGERGAERGARSRTLLGFVVALLLGIVFIVLQILDWSSEPFTVRSGEYGSIFFVTTGFHLAHLVVGVIALLLVLAWSALGYFDARRNTPVLIVAAYWYFVVVVGVAVFLSFYVLPYLW
jgi:cytochrome c oxidase subunit 3